MNYDNNSCVPLALVLMLAVIVALITGLIVHSITSKSWADEAIAHGKAHYILEKPTSTQAKFEWLDEPNKETPANK
jgi:hypothetical protein